MTQTSRLSQRRSSALASPSLPSSSLQHPASFVECSRRCNRRRRRCSGSQEGCGDGRCRTNVITSRGCASPIRGGACEKRRTPPWKICSRWAFPPPAQRIARGSQKWASGRGRPTRQQRQQQRQQQMRISPLLPKVRASAVAATRAPSPHARLRHGPRLPRMQPSPHHPCAFALASLAPPCLRPRPLLAPPRVLQVWHR